MKQNASCRVIPINTVLKDEHQSIVLVPNMVTMINAFYPQFSVPLFLFFFLGFLFDCFFLFSLGFTQKKQRNIFVSAR